MWNCCTFQKKFRFSKLISRVQRKFVDAKKTLPITRCMPSGFNQRPGRVAKCPSTAARRQGRVRAKNDLSARLRHSSFSNIHAINGYRRRGESGERTRSLVYYLIIFRTIELCMYTRVCKIVLHICIYVFVCGVRRRDCSRMVRLIANQPLYGERSGGTESLLELRDVGYFWSISQAISSRSLW